MGSRSWTRVFATLALLLGCTLIQAQGQQEDGEAARQLLHRAVDYYRAQGDAAFAAFSRQGEFIDGELYVFVIDTHGTMLASGGASAGSVGTLPRHSSQNFVKRSANRCRGRKIRKRAPNTAGSMRATAG